MNQTVFPFTEIAGSKLTSEQTAYLDGLFAGIRERGFTFSRGVGSSAPASAPAAGAALQEPLGDLIFEERVKRELHPLDSYPLLLEHASANRAPERENVFRFKWHGLFHLTPNKEGYMARLRIPGGQLRSFQLREIASIAKELTSGYVQITTRANLQLRLIQPKDAPEFLSRIQSVGLHSRGSGADNVRNLTANPTAGIDRHELIDTLPLCHQLAQIILNNREFYNLPRKFNIAFDGGGLIGTVEDTNDIGLKAVMVANPPAGLSAGVYFRVALGGATGHQAFARDLGVIVPPEKVLDVTSALVRVFIAHGCRTDRKKARLKHLLDKWPLEKYREETEKLLGWKLADAPAGEPPPGAASGGLEVLHSHGGASPLETRGRAVPDPESEVPHSHVGVFPQKQSGLNYIGAAIPVGQVTPKQLLRIAEIADNYGSGEVRLTVWQNLIIPNIPDAAVENVKRALVKMGFHWQQSNLRSGFIACTGNSYCKFASSNTKGHAMALMEHLDQKFKLDRPINIHLTGCPHSCAQHYMGDIGLLGAKVKVAGETVEGYHVFVGGGFGANQAVGRQVFQGVSFEEMKPTLEKILRGYLTRRTPGESFLDFTKRHDLNALQVIFTEGK